VSGDYVSFLADLLKHDLVTLPKSIVQEEHLADAALFAFESNRVSSEQPVKESLADFLPCLAVLPRGGVKRRQEFLLVNIA
jgi:hypothetical protein